MNKYTDCSSGVVYRIPSTCGSVYIRQSGRYLNIRLREYANFLKLVVSSYPASNYRDLGCVPYFEDISIIKKHNDQATNEMAQAYIT